MKQPKWLDDAIFYEIYPQSFCDTNADGIGDFQGINNKLDYIKETGFNAIWMNPCFDSPFGDAGYDVADYYMAAPRYGTNEDLKCLFEEVHKRQMHILLDLVPGHTSTEHKWFKESLKAEKNAYTDRYVWTDSIWESPDGMGALRGISDRDGSCACNFFSHQPALNYGYYERTKSWQQAPEAEGPQATLEEMKNVMRFWLTMGCDGFRVDMAGSLVKNDPESKGTIALWQSVRSFLEEEFPHAAMVSEWGYKGMLHQPDPDAKPDMYKGIVAIRKLHLEALRDYDFTCADEMLYPENYRYLSDLLSYTAIGARSVENQQHRLTASGVEVPVGMKNPTSGDLNVMLNSIKAAQSSHTFLYRGWEVISDGNPCAHAILRGYIDYTGKSISNYHYEDLVQLDELFMKSGLVNPSVIVDTNHNNSAKKYLEQIRIAKDVVYSRNQNADIKRLVKGLMIESYLEDGCQSVGEHVYGKSITDPCLGWEKTERLIYDIAEKL